MKKDWSDVITKEIGVEPVEINSSLVSAQSRRRLYWTNIPFDKNIPDKGILLKDILLEPGYVDRDKSYCVMGKGQRRPHVFSSPTYAVLYGITGINHGDRALLSEEREVLQTIPRGFTDTFTKTPERNIAIGNAWTVDIIAHILKGIPIDSTPS